MPGTYRPDDHRQGSKVPRSGRHVVAWDAFAFRPICVLSHGPTGRGGPVGDQHNSAVRRFRLRAGLTQEELAERSGVSTRTIRGLETGDRRNPQLASLRQLADAMDLTPGDRDELMAE